MRIRCRETDQFVVKEDGREYEDVGQMLPTVIGMVCDESLALRQLIDIVEIETRLEGRTDRAEVHSIELCLSNDAAIAVEQRRRCIIRFPNDRCIGRAYELQPPFARCGN